MIQPGTHGETPVEESRRRIPCVKGPDVTGLWKLGMQAASHFGGPQDIEWAIHDGKLYLLQSRPDHDLRRSRSIRTAFERHARRNLASLSDNHGAGVVHNISETLPHPTPLTWSVIKRFMSGAGGFGAMSRQAGFEPSPAVAGTGF